MTRAIKRTIVVLYQEGRRSWRKILQSWLHTTIDQSRQGLKTIKRGNQTFSQTEALTKKQNAWKTNLVPYHTFFFTFSFSLFLFPLAFFLFCILYSLFSFSFPFCLPQYLLHQPYPNKCCNKNNQSLCIFSFKSNSFAKKT